MGLDFPLVQTGPGAHPASYTMGTGSFPGVKCGRGVTLTTQPLLVPWSWKSRAIPLPTLWATTGPVTGTLYLTVSIGDILDTSPRIFVKQESVLRTGAFLRCMMVNRLVTRSVQRQSLSSSQWINEIL